MKLLGLMLCVFFVTACSNSGSSDPAPCTSNCIKGFSGVPANLNGTWSGVGSGEIQGQKMENLTFVVRFSKMPLNMDMSLDIFDKDGQQFMQVQLKNHSIENNTIIDRQDKKNVGSAGAGGFNITRDNSYITGVLADAIVAGGANFLRMEGASTEGGQNMSFRVEVRQSNVQN